MNSNAPQAAIDRVVAEIERMGSRARRAGSSARSSARSGKKGAIDQNHLASLDGVEKVVPIMKPYKLASREFHEEDSVVKSAAATRRKIEDRRLVMRRASPGRAPSKMRRCSNRIARHVRDGGATILRGGVYKPRTSPYSFQGLGVEALKWMRACGDELGMPICVEVMDTRQVEQMEKFVDCFQIGARNMQNFDLLREVGKTTQARCC